MTTTITGAAAHEPNLFLLYKWGRKSGNLEKDLVGTTDVAMTLRGSGPRRGTFAALFLELDDAVAFDDDLAAAGTFTLVDTDRAPFNMTFVLPEGGEHSVEIDDDTRDHWTVPFDFLEITP